MPRCIPTIPNDDESFDMSSHVYTLDPPSKFWIIRFTPSSLSFSIFLRPISGTSLHPFQSSSTIGEKLSYFPAAKHTFPFVFTRFNTRCISAVILIIRHGFKFKIELVAFIFVRESISCFFLFFIREKN